MFLCSNTLSKKLKLHNIFKELAEYSEKFFLCKLGVPTPLSIKCLRTLTPMLSVKRFVRHLAIIKVLCLSENFFLKEETTFSWGEGGWGKHIQFSLKSTKKQHLLSKKKKKNFTYLYYTSSHPKKKVHLTLKI